MEKPITRVKIGPIVYKVEVKANYKDENGKPFYATIDYSRNVITLNIAEHQTMTQALFHEIFHGIFHNQGITEADEMKLDVLATGIYLLLRDNPKLRTP